MKHNATLLNRLNLPAPFPLQILDRKNGELDELKTMYRAKQKESEESVSKLEKKGERSWGHGGGRAWRQTQGNIYSSVSLHTQSKTQV